MSAENTPPKSSRRTLIIGCTILIVLVSLAYSRLGTLGFVGYGDNVYVTSNFTVTNGLSIQNIGWAFTNLDMVNNWHPITWLSHMKDVTLFGVEPAGHHITNLLIHLLACCALFFALNTMTKAPGRSLAVALLFGLHPLNVETVAWVADRKNILAAFFMFTSLWSYARFRITEKPGFNVLSISLYALALMSNSVVIIFPILLVFLDRWPLSHTDNIQPGTLWKSAKEKWLFFGMAIITAVIHVIGQSNVVRPLVDVTITQKAANAAMSYGAYLIQAVVPTGLTVYYPFSPENTVWGLVALAAIAILSVTFAAIMLQKKAPQLFTGWVWYLISLLPVIGVLQTGGTAHSDSYAYIPLVGIFIALVWSIPEKLMAQPSGRMRMAAVLGIVCAVLGVLTWNQTRVWKDNETLFTHNLKVHPENNTIALLNLANNQIVRGDTEAALAHFNEVLSIKPDDATALINLAMMAINRNDLDAASEFLNQAEEGSVSEYLILANKGRIAMLQNKTEEGIALLDQAVELNDNYAPTLVLLGTTELGRGNTTKAIALLRRGAELSPDNLPARANLAIALYNLGRTEEAAKYFEEALAINPDHLPSILNYSHLCIQTNNPDRAIQLLTHYTVLESQNADAHAQLAQAYLLKGKSEEALESLQKAFDLSPRNPLANKLRNEMRTQSNQ